MKKIRICIPVQGTWQEIELQLRRIPKEANGADFVEIWLDRVYDEWLKHPDILKALFKLAPRPVIAVCKGIDERGRFSVSDKEKIEFLIEALRFGAHYIDIPLGTPKKLILKLKNAAKKYKRKGIIVSYHDFKGTPALERMRSIADRAFAGGAACADIFKIATHIRRWPENVLLFELTQELVAQKRKVIVIGMGERGKVTRAGCPALGAFLTFASLDKKNATASGQMTIGELQTLLK